MDRVKRQNVRLGELISPLEKMQTMEESFRSLSASWPELACEPVQVLAIAVDVPDAIRQIGLRLPTVENPYVMTLIGQTADDVRADEVRPADDKYLHG